MVSAKETVGKTKATRASLMES